MRSMAAEHAPAPAPTDRMADATARPRGRLGRAFDPTHPGHPRLAEGAREALGLGSLRLIPAGRPPPRGEPGSTAEDGLAMAHLAIAGNPALQVDDGEVRAQHKSYTVLTLERLRSEVGPQRPLVL